MDDPHRSKPAIYTAFVQGAYYVLTGILPLVSMRRFEQVTGPKTDRWLVKTVGVLVATIGGALLVAGARRRVSPELALTAAGSAAGLAVIDATYVAQRRISKVYLLDALAELAFVVAWIGVVIRGDRQ